MDHDGGEGRAEGDEGLSWAATAAARACLQALGATGAACLVSGVARVTAGAPADANRALGVLDRLADDDEDVVIAPAHAGGSVIAARLRGRDDEHLGWLGAVAPASPARPPAEVMTALATAAGGGLAVAIEAAGTDALREQAALRAIAISIAREPDETRTFDEVAREVARLLDVEAGIVWRFEAGRSVVVGSHGDHSSRVGIAFPLSGGGAVPRVAATGRPQRARYADLDAQDPTARRVLPQGYRSGVAAPVRVAGRVWGAVLAATTREDEISAGAARRLERFADLVGLAIATARTREDLAARASTDGLTGLANHATFTAALEAALDGARDAPVGLVLIDLDRFKSINDRRGHPVGDRVLAEFAERLRAEARRGDVVGRTGGEEFGWILPGSGDAEALAAAERLRARIAASPLAGDVPVTVSLGIASARPGSSTAEALYRRADVALYESKRAGRNRATLDPAPA